MRLNERRITSTKPTLPAGKDEFIFFDDDIPGLGLRVRRSGSRSWCFQYWRDGRARRLTLGKWPRLNASKARELVSGLAAKVALGGDPAADKIEDRKRKESFGEIAELFLARQAKRLKPRSLVEVERHLNVNAKPLHSVAIDKLSRRDVAELLTTLAAEKGAVTANRARASISAMLSWAIKQGLAESNPAAFTAKEAEGSRSRVLTAEELAGVWGALPDGDYGDIVKLLILTGQRRDEIGSLRWSEIDLRKGIIALPPERVKNNRAHVVPMSEPVKQIIAAIPRTERRDFVFGYGNGGFAGWSKSKERINARLRNISPWTIHDLRRTAATGMAEIGIAPHIVEAVINHASGHKNGVAGIYNRASYENEKRDALDRWAAHVVQIVTTVERAA